MKYLVETMGDYMLTDVFGGQEISALRPTVVKPSPFIESQRGKKIRVLAELSDEADDATLAQAEDLEAAVAALPAFDEKPAPKAAAKKTT